VETELARLSLLISNLAAIVFSLGFGAVF
jgi:hypothetical protein